MEIKSNGCFPGRCVIFVFRVFSFFVVVLSISVIFVGKIRKTPTLKRSLRGWSPEGFKDSRSYDLPGYGSTSNRFFGKAHHFFRTEKWS